MGQPKKVTDEMLWGALEATAGLFAQAARKIEEEHGITITRAAVRERALKEPERLQEIREAVGDMAEGILLKNMKAQDKRVSQKAVEFYLRGPAKDRGYVDRREIGGVPDNPLVIVATDAEAALLKEKLSGGS